MSSNKPPSRKPEASVKLNKIYDDILHLLAELFPSGPLPNTTCIKGPLDLTSRPHALAGVQSVAAKLAVYMLALMTPSPSAGERSAQDLGLSQLGIRITDGMTRGSRLEALSLQHHAHIHATAIRNAVL